MSMPSDNAVYWRDLAAADRAAHADEAARALTLENEQLRLRTAELAAALVQAREAIAVRHRIIEDQHVAIAERDRQVAEAAEQARGAREELTAVLSSRRWQAGEAVSRVARAPRAVLRRLGQSR